LFFFCGDCVFFSVRPPPPPLLCLPFLDRLSISLSLSLFFLLRPCAVAGERSARGALGRCLPRSACLCNGPPAFRHRRDGTCTPSAPPTRPRSAAASRRPRRRAGAPSGSSSAPASLARSRPGRRCPQAPPVVRVRTRVRLFASRARVRGSAAALVPRRRRDVGAGDNCACRRRRLAPADLGVRVDRAALCSRSGCGPQRAVITTGDRA